jgi:hypothetical protein
MSARTDRFFGHPQCYARELGDCSTGISKEHYVPAVVLRGVSLGEPTVLVQNLSFQQPGMLEGRGISSLAAKVLCEKHNAALSVFDNAGSTLFAGMDRMDSAAGRAGAPPETFVVNGDHLERWMLKMLCGGLYSGTMLVPGGSMKGVCPPLEWLNVLFRGATVPPGQGLYLRAGTPGEVFSTEPAILKMAAVVDKDNIVIGFRMWVFNFEYLLVLAHLPPTLPPMLDHAHYRPAGLVVEGTAKDIRFEWGQPSGSKELRVAWVGPSFP